MNNAQQVAACVAGYRPRPTCLDTIKRGYRRPTMAEQRLTNPFAGMCQAEIDRYMAARRPSQVERDFRELDTDTPEESDGLTDNERHLLQVAEKIYRDHRDRGIPMPRLTEWTYKRIEAARKKRDKIAAQ